MAVLTLVLAVVLALSHLYCGKLTYRGLVPKRVWLSAAGGISVAYVFVHILPDLGHYQRIIERADILTFFEAHAYLVALIGLAVFYGLERGTTTPHGAGGRRAQRDFWAHIGGFGLYNALIGYLLVVQQEAFSGALLYALAMGLHFVVNDNALRARHPRRYDSVGRWVLAASIVAGWFVGQYVFLTAAKIALFSAFLAGGIILNVLKEELPGEKESHFVSFAVSAAAFSALLLIVSGN